MEPINYTVDVKSPFEQTLQGFQLGGALGELQEKRKMAELQRQQQMQMQKDLGALAQNPNPTARDYATVMTRYPSISEHLKKGFDILQPEQQQARLGSAAQVYAAVTSGKNDVAINKLREEAQAMRNGGDEKGAKSADDWAKIIELNPAAAKTSMGLMLSAVAGADKFATMFPAIGREGREADAAPAEIAKKIADANRAQVDAKYAESKALGDLEKQGWDITKIRSDIDVSRENNRIKAMEAELARETNALKRQELQIKIEEATRKHDESIRETAGKAESARYNMDNMLNTIDRILKNPALKDVIGSIEGKENYPNTAMAMAAKAANIANPLYTPTSADQRTDAMRLIETLGSQAFLSQIPQIKGMGQLSNAEGDKLQSAFQNFNRQQSETQFKTSLAEAQRLLLKARRSIANTYGVPDTKPDRPTADKDAPPKFMDFNK